MPDSHCPEPVVQSLQLTCDKLEKLEDRIARTSKWAIGIAVPVIVIMLSSAITLYAQSERESVTLVAHLAVDDVREASAQAVRQRQSEVRELQASMLARLTAAEGNVTDIKDTIRENNTILRDLAQRIGSGKK